MNNRKIVNSVYTKDDLKKLIRQNILRKKDKKEKDINKQIAAQLEGIEKISEQTPSQ